MKSYSHESRFLLGLGMGIISLVVLLGVFGPTLAPFDPTVSSDSFSEPPPPLVQWPHLLSASFEGRLHEPVHWFGTDASGLDVLSRTLVATRVDLLVAVTANAISFVLGVGLGLMAGFYRHWSTELVVRISDSLQSFPVFITAMILVALAGRTAVNLIIALTLLYTPIYLRLTRSEALAQAGRLYVESTRSLGCPEWRIAFFHVLPNSLAPALVQSSVTVGFAILLTAGLSFVGAGIRPPAPEWGLMIANGAGGIVLGEWWPAAFPGIAISTTVFGFAALGQALEQRYAE